MTPSQKERASVDYAENVFRTLFPEEESHIRLINLLGETIKYAHSLNINNWSLTLFNDHIRLNVGQVEVLVLKQNLIMIVILDSSQIHLEEYKDYSNITESKFIYKSIPFSHRQVFFHPRYVEQVYTSLVKKNHLEFISIASGRKNGTSWKSSFSPGVIKYINSKLSIPIPYPKYYSDERIVNDSYPDQISEERKNRYLEGSLVRIWVDKYERNPEARQRCIQYYGTVCSVCGLNMETMYGSMARGFIHIHHLIALSDIRVTHEVDPINDLRPVCPNCHAMLHKREPIFSIEELKEIIRNQNEYFSK